MLDVVGIEQVQFRFLIFNGSYEGSGRPAWQIKWAA
jgi:hypothetical protein